MKFHDKYDDCHAAILNLSSFYAAHVSERNEATTRLHLIDKLIFDCLGWEAVDVVAEEHHRTERDEYTDYTFFAPRRVMLWEAKRENVYFEIPIGNTGKSYKLKSLCRENTALKAAIDQATGYCQNRGIPIAVITNGHQLVAYIAVRSDGTPPMDGRAIVFPDLAYMANKFHELWNLLSKSAIEDRRIYSHLLDSFQAELPRKLSSTLGVEYPGTKGRNLFQTDLKVVADIVFEDIIGSTDLEEEFLKRCYCRSGLLSRYALASRSILHARYAALFDSASPGPATTPAMTQKGLSEELIARSISRRPVLLLGDVGVGKTIFIRQLIRLDGALSTEHAITIYLDLGHEANLAISLKDHILESITSKLLTEYGVDIFSDAFVRGIYRDDLQRFASTSIYARLKDSNPDVFIQNELSLLESKIKNLGEHLRISLEHLAKGRQKQVVLFLDNADQRGFATQDEAFLIAQELAAKWPLLVYIPLRPETFHRSKSAGALTGYHDKAFTIEPPRIEEVLDKRLAFSLEVIDGRVALPFMNDDMSLKKPQLRTMIRVTQSSLRDSESLQECIDNLSGSNVRAALGFVREFFGSGHVDASKIIDAYNSPRGYDIPVHEFLRAMIYGDLKYYLPSSPTPVANLFDISTGDGSEHFCLPAVLSYLRRGQQGNASKQGFVEANRTYDSMQGVGFTADQIDFALVRGYRKKLIETPARQAIEDSKVMPRAFRLTTIGSYHVERLIGMFTYVDAVIVDTPILDADSRKQIQDVVEIEERVERVRTFAAYLDGQWARKSSMASIFDWQRVSRMLLTDTDAVLTKSRKRHQR